MSRMTSPVPQVQVLSVPHGNDAFDGPSDVLVALTHEGGSLILDVRDPGAGLGLSVVQQVTERLGGTLQFTHDVSGHRARVMRA